MNVDIRARMQAKKPAPPSPEKSPAARQSDRAKSQSLTFTNTTTLADELTDLQADRAAVFSRTYHGSHDRGPRFRARPAMMSLTIPIDLVAIYSALGWRLVHEGCCGMAYVVPPQATAATIAQLVFGVAR